ncbi:MAG: hypothetical protein EOO28_19515 [Comamonadaceae bacterium]|nr:MAG: hypothetical protein EOO28_19515 [Comamonadaceae bacterium]
MDTSAHRIQQALETVARLRLERAREPALAAANSAIKRFQARRFRATYADLLSDRRHGPAAQFFLDELYGDRDFAQRDAQFARIASAMARLFPQSVVDTAMKLAQVHALTEQLDDLMARKWLEKPPPRDVPAEIDSYVHAWRAVAERRAREEQLAVVLDLGRSLDGLTRAPGLRTLLRMMRRPADAAGLGSLQTFLEGGFDAFSSMRGAAPFLAQVEAREARLLTLLFEASPEAATDELRQLLHPGHQPAH